MFLLTLLVKIPAFIQQGGNFRHILLDILFISMLSVLTGPMAS
jgi:hypothetical protein